MSQHVEPVRVVYIGGPGRSGSTLVERLLGALPGVCNVGEVVHLWERGLVRGERCGCGVPIRQCPFWREVGEVAFGGWDSFNVPEFLALKQSVDRNRFIPRLLADPDSGRRLFATSATRRSAAEYAAVYARLYRAVRQVSRCTVIVDTSKHASLAFCLRVEPGIDLRVIHLVRDSRAVAYSWTRRVRRPEAADVAGASNQYMANFPAARTAMRWNITNLGFHLLAVRGTPARLMRYEDFIAAPVAGMQELAEFAGVKPDLSFMTDTGADLGLTHTAGGNPMRFSAGWIEFRRDDDWHAKLRPGARALVTTLTFPLLARYGYLRSPDGAVTRSR
ncbi:MAG TPA: sulfotransferase [Streptosporangiaceae bacterium]|nr:sulfotransferase [Streptosporangiaceae bacterium]